MNVSFYRLSELALRNRRLLLGLPIATALIGAAVFSLYPPTFMAEARFSPQRGEEGGGRLAGLAAQFGVDLASGGSVEPLDFYIELLVSRTLLEETVATPFPPASRPGKETLAEVLAPDAIPTERINEAVRVLYETLQVIPNARANLVTLRITSGEPEVAEFTLTRMLQLVQTFNIEKRQSSAAAERIFAQERLGAARSELRVAENAFKEFMRRNKRWQESSQLAFEGARLQAEVDLRQEVATSLAQAHERARIDEVRNTPVFTVLDAPAGSARRTGSTLPLVVVVGLFMGGMIALIIIAVREFLAVQRERDPEAYNRLRKLRSARESDPKVPSRPLGEP